METAMNRLGVFLEGLPARVTVDMARRAESAGFDRVWIPEIVFADAFVPSTAVALSTKRIEVGTGVVGIWSRSPVAMGLEAYTLHDVSGGRAILGLGTQAKGYVENWHGRRYERPVRAMREFLTILRRIVDLEETTYEGEIFSVRGFRLQALPTERRLRLYVAAIGPKMVQLAGELADGLLGYFYSVEYLRDVVLPNLQIGAARAGRSLDGFDVGVGLPANVGDPDRSIDELRGQILMFATAAGSSPAYAKSISAAGFGDTAEEVRERARAGDTDGALAAISPEFVDALTVSGNPVHARERIAAYTEAGATSVAVNPAAPHAFYPLYAGHLEGLTFPEFDFDGYLRVIGDTMDALAR
ncbi:F420-dependent glucose-6-phosphate dehydrogenase [bacterium BMS3Abin02]|nr:F420-dependent glucose-6-phosphate dehydrogenase [bacterium BMS3Abin02]